MPLQMKQPPPLVAPVVQVPAPVTLSSQPALPAKRPPPAKEEAEEEEEYYDEEEDDQTGSLFA